MFFTRLISGIVLVLGAVLVMTLGHVWLLAVLGILSLIGIYELLRVFQIEKTPMAVTTYVTAVLYDVLLYFDGGYWGLALLVLFILALLVIYVIQYPKLRIEKVTGCLYALFYVCVLLGFVYQTRCMPQGHWLVWLILIGSWGSDTCAYVVGVLIGRHHFSELSPKKTVEGCIGGIVGAGLIGFVYAFFFPYHELFILSPKLVFPLVAVVCAVISQFGDLAASAIKRNYEVKDYGNLIPGHGGVLDRFDSVIFVAPFVYYLLVFTSYIG